MPRKPLPSRLALAIALALPCFAGAADAPRALRVDAAPLPRCLEQIAAATGARFIVSPALAASAPDCRAVDGATDAAMALDAALSARDIAWRLREDGVYLVASTAPVAAGTLETLAVEDTALEGGDGDAGAAMPAGVRPAVAALASRTSYARAELEAMPLARFNQLGRLAPNVYSSGQSLSIRGVPRDNDYFTGSGVSFDGIDVGTLLLDHNLLPVDGLESIDVARGPAAFEPGAGAPGGQIALRSAAPSPQPALSLAALAGERSAWSAGATAGGPLLADGSLSGRVSLSVADEPRFVRSAVNPALADDVDRRERLHARLRWEPESLPGLAVDFAGFHVAGDAPDRTVARPGPDVPFDLFDEVSHDRSAIDWDLEGSGAGLRADWTGADGLRLAAYLDALVASRDALVSTLPGTRFSREDDEERARAGLAAAMPLGDAFRLSASAERRSLDRAEAGITVLSQAPVNGVAYRRTETDQLELDATALALELAWQGDRWRAAAGARHVSEDVGFRFRDRFVPVDGPVDDRETLRTDSDYSRTLPSAALAWDVSPTHSVAATWGRGLRSGGFSEVLVVGEYAPERLDTAELSWHGRWRDDRLRTQATLFRTDWRDRASIDGTIGAEIVEPFRTRIDGAEFEVQADLGAAWSLRGGLGLMDAEHRSGRYSLFLREFDLAGREVADVPERTAVLGAIWRGDGGWSAAVDAWHAGPAASSTFVREAVGEEVPARREAYTVVDARIAWQDGPWRVALTATNLFDEEYIDRYVERRAFSRIIGEPRQVDLTVTWTW
jgi:iron complex outermembrane receptor protein